MQEMSFDEIFAGNDGDDNSSPTPGAGTNVGGMPKRRGRRPKGTAGVVALTKSDIKEALTLANMPIQFTGYAPYALTAPEIDKLADVWYDVIKQNPYVAKYLVGARKLGMWGNFFLVHAQLVMRRFDIYNQMQKHEKAGTNAQSHVAGPARTNGGTERDRKDDASPKATLLS